MAAVCCFAITMIQGCSSSTLVDVWNNPTYHETSLKKILIISMRKDPISRRIWEDAFVGELAKSGVKALPSYHLFPNVLPDTDQVTQVVQDKGFDGIIITRLLDQETKSHYVPGYVISDRQAQFNIFRQRYIAYYHYIHHAAYVESEIVDCRSIEVWTLRNEEQLIWSATSNSPEGNSVESVSDDVAGLVTGQLVKHGVIEAGK